MNKKEILFDAHFVQILAQTPFKTPLEFMRFALLQEIDKHNTKFGEVFRFWYEKVQSLQLQDFQEILDDFKWGNLEIFLDKHLENYLENRYEYYQEQISIFEKKYQSTWEQMHQNLGEITKSNQYDIFELEDDFRDWTTYVSFKKSYEKRLNQYRNGRN